MSDRAFLDWPFFDDSHRRLADGLEAWCSAELTDEEPSDVDAACRALVRKLGESGWLRYCVPASHGGVHERLDVRSLALIRETLARHSGLADFVFAMQGLGSGTISLFGTEAQKQAYLPAVAKGEKIAAFAHGMTKRQLDMEWAVGIDTAIEMEAQAQAICMQTRDFTRAYEAFAAKRTPEFKGD